MTTSRKRSAKPRARRYLPLLIPLVFSACSAPKNPVSIEFSAVWQGAALDCDSPGLALTDLRFFVSQASVIDSSGDVHRLSPAPAGAWQQSDVVLIDLENGDGNCQNGTAQRNSVFTGTSTAENVAGIRFTVGVPFDLNHADPLQATAPLNSAAMHWHWRSGYKFLRAGVVTEDDGFWVHLGSTGCEGTVQNISGCSFPNRVHVEFANATSRELMVTVDLATLFADIDLNDAAPSDCSSSPAEADCAGPFYALGLPFGSAKRERPQRVFELQQ